MGRCESNAAAIHGKVSFAEALYFYKGHHDRLCHQFDFECEITVLSVSLGFIFKGQPFPACHIIGNRLAYNFVSVAFPISRNR